MQMIFTESETVELKRTTSELKESVISIASMLNKHQRGSVYFGIRKDGVILGQDVSDKTIRDISQAISNHIEPRIFPVISKSNLEGKECVVVDFEGCEIPYFAYGRAYIRVGDEDRLLSSKEIENIILEKNRENLRWETRVCDRAALRDISPEKLKNFLRSSGLRYDDAKNTLTKLNMTSCGKPLNAAVMLFGKKPERFFPNARLRCATFGTANTSVIIDMKDYDGDLFSLILKAEEYIMEHINIGMRLDGLRRVDVPEIDRDALREAIINAFCHRDYSEYDSVNVAIFRDRVEVRSPGGLFGGLTIEQIITQNVSRRRNELIADIFHRVHFVEKWGRGIELILSKEPEASFREIAGTFVTVFQRKDPLDKRWSDKWSEKWSGLHENQRRMLALMAENPRISRKELAESLGINQSAVQKHIERLKSLGILRRMGPAKGGRWVVLMPPQYTQKDEE